MKHQISKWKQASLELCGGAMFLGAAAAFGVLGHKIAERAGLNPLDVVPVAVIPMLVLAGDYFRQARRMMNNSPNP